MFTKLPTEKDIRNRATEELREYKNFLDSVKDGPSQDLIDVDSEIPEATIVFKVNELGNVGVKMGWSASSEKLPEALGTLLYLLNNGDLNAYCIQSLTNAIKEDASQIEFVESCLATWNNKIKSTAEEQIVKPSEVFQMGRQNINRPNHSQRREGGV